MTSSSKIRSWLENRKLKQCNIYYTVIIYIVEEEMIARWMIVMNDDHEIEGRERVSKKNCVAEPHACVRCGYGDGMIAMPTISIFVCSCVLLHPSFISFM